LNRSFPGEGVKNIGREDEVEKVHWDTEFAHCVHACIGKNNW
jgi:hypothetical protein